MQYRTSYCALVVNYLNREPNVSDYLTAAPFNQLPKHPKKNRAVKNAKLLNRLLSFEMKQVSDSFTI